jgi:hypothetical protein
LTESEVVAILGEPLESRDTADGRKVWRYYEEFQPRGCVPVLFGLPLGGPPRWTREVVVAFQDDAIDQVQIKKKGGDSSKRTRAPQNNELQRTKPAQATELRR